MAKGNLILGTAKNSVGDVVMYRREGAQITRVRVRNVKNPKTNAQSFQRAIMAPIAKFYSPLSVVLERSFEGLSKAKSHNKFNQVNANLARKNKWALPKGTGFFPLPYQLSQGTLPSVSCASLGADKGIQFGGSTTPSEMTTVGHLSLYLIANGFQNGDVVTFIAVSKKKVAETFSYAPIATQIIIDDASEVLLTEALTGILITIEQGPIRFKTNQDSTVAGVVIVSRFDGSMWRRSTQSLVVDTEEITAVTSDAAVAAAIASYGMSAGEGNPLVYLDGDELTDGQ